jgi:hypothetical protein
MKEEEKRKQNELQYNVWKAVEEDINTVHLWTVTLQWAGSLVCMIHYTAI